MLALLGTAAIGALPKSADAAPQHTQQLPATQRQKIFDFVWNRVHDQHYDPKFNGLDWVAVRKKYLPKALKASTDFAFYDTLNEMLGELKQSHLGVIPPETVRTASTDRPTVPRDRSGQTGITALLVGKEVVVTEVQTESGAAEVGIRPGMTLISINGHPLAPILQRFVDRKPAFREGELRVEVWATVRGMLAGPAGKTLKLTAKADTDTQTSYEVPLKPPPGQMVTFGALPSLPANVESRTLTGGIGYVRFNVFLLPLIDPIRKVVNGFAEAKASGIIMDVRGNPGGIGIMASTVAALFLDKKADLGTMKTRTNELHFPVFPQPPHYAGPVVILTDEASLSTSEILAAGLQEIKRAVVVGRPTGGMVLPSQVEVLPGGGEFQYVFADFHTPKGVRLEAKGVIPDIPVNLTPELLLAHPDPVLDAAIEYINGQTKSLPASP